MAVRNKLIMRWNEAKELWFMIGKDGKDFKVRRFIQEFFDCGNVHKHFEDLSTTEDNHYEVVITKENQMTEKAEAGRLTSKYTIEITNDKGAVTIEGTVIVRDQSFGDASVQLAATLEALFAPAKAKGQL